MNKFCVHPFGFAQDKLFLQHRQASDHTASDCANAHTKEGGDGKRDDAVRIHCGKAMQIMDQGAENES